MDALAADDGTVMGNVDPMDFLEPVTQLLDGRKCGIDMIGTLVNPSASSPQNATSRVGTRNLKHAHAQDLLSFMRRRRDEDGTTVFQGDKWLQAVPVSGGVDTLQDGLKRIRESVEELARSKFVSVKKAPAARWNVDLWKITLL